MRKIIIYNVIIIVVLFGSMELTTRVMSWISGHGFTLAHHEVDPHHRKIKDIYQWHPFVGFTFRPNSELTGSHPNQKESATVYIDQHGFLATDKGLKYEKTADEIRIATIGGLYQFTPGLTIPAIFKGIRRYNDILQRVAMGASTGWVDNGNRCRMRMIIL
jgi:hypothetical protein